MISVEFLDQKAESDEVTSYSFEIRALPDPEQRAQAICDKISNGLLERYGSNEQFAVEVSIVGANSARQTLIIEARIKDEKIPATSLADFISNNIRISE